MLYLGNLDAGRDWGHARDYVEAQWLTLQQDSPDDYVIASGKQYSVRDFVNAAFTEVGIDIEWQGSGVNEKGRDKKTGKTLIRIDPRYFRPTEVATLLGDPSKAHKQLGWKAKTRFETMVAEMIKEDLKESEREALCQREGYRTYQRHE